MKNWKKALMTTITVFLIALFVMLPVTANAADNTFNIDTGNIVVEGASGTEFYTKTFTASKYQVFSAEYTYSSLSGYISLYLYDANGNIVDSDLASNSMDELEYEFPAAGTYTFKACKEGTGFKMTAALNLKLETPPEKIYKFQNFKATRYKNDNGSYYIQFACDRNNLMLNGETCSSVDPVWNTDVLIYRENTKTGQIKLVKSCDYAYNAYMQDETVCFDHSYRYYILKEGVRADRFTSTELPKLNKTMKLTDATRTKLKKYGNYTGIFTIPKPVVATVTNFKSTSGAPLKTKLTWNNSGARVSYYVVKRYNKAGTAVAQSFKVTHNSSSHTGQSKEIYVPYSGTYKVTITPYYTYNPYSGFNKTYTGTTKTLTAVKCARLEPAGGTVTKINANRASITIYKPYGAKGTDIYQYKNGSWVCIKKGFTGTNFTVTTTNSGNCKYKFKSYLVDNGTAYRCNSFSTVFTPKVNQGSWANPTSASAYKDASHFYRAEIVKSADGKITLKSRFINTHIWDMSMKVKVTIKVNGNAIGTTTISSGRIASDSTKTTTVTLKNSMTTYDLPRAQHDSKLTYTYTILSTNMY